MSEKHPLERGESYMINWLNFLNTKESSEEKVSEIKKLLDDSISGGNILTKLVAHICYYNPETSGDLKRHIFGDHQLQCYLMGFLEASSVTQNIAAKPMNLDEFKTFKVKLIRMINNAYGLDPILPLDISNEDINKIFQEYEVGYEICEINTNGDTRYTIKSYRR